MYNTPMSVTLRVEPSSIPALRAAVSEAVHALSDQLTRLQDEGFLHEPWLGDEVSNEIRNYYNRNVMDARDGPYAALAAYRSELTAVHDTLERMEVEYRRTEGEVAAMKGLA